MINLSAAPASPAEVARRHRSAAWLSVFDGQRRIGLVIDTRKPQRGAPPAPSFAFDREDRPLGEFANRRLGMLAVTVRDDFERSRQRAEAAA